jgi:hypothetical protein
MTASSTLNKLEFPIKTYKAKDGTKIWYAKIIIDGLIINTKNAIDWTELAASCKKTGNYFIFTCDCGFPECGGIWKPVRVTVLKKLIRWKMPYPEPARNFQFDRLAIVKEFQIGISKIKRKVEVAGLENEWTSNYPVGPFGTDHSKIKDCLNNLDEIITSLKK